MQITDKILDNYKKLGKNKNTWGYTYTIYGKKTKIHIHSINECYYIYILQNYNAINTWGSRILLGEINQVADFEQLFCSLTRGELINDI